MKSTHAITTYFRENRTAILLGVACLTVVDFLQLVIPRIIKLAVDDLTAYSVDMAGLLTYAGWIMIIAILIASLRYVWRRCLIGTSRRVEEGLRNRLFAHVQTLSAAYFDRTKTGDLMAHATNDIQHIRMATGMGMVALTDAVVLGTAAIGFMLYINVTLTLLVLIPMPFIVFSTRVFTRRMHRMYQNVQASFSDLTEAVRERFAGIRIIKAYNRQQDATRSIVGVSQEYVDRNLKLVKIIGAFFPMMLLFSNLSLAIVLYVGGRQTIAATITTGDFVAFISYLGLLTWPMMAMGWVVNLMQRGKASLDRINTILSTRPDIATTAGARPIEGTDLTFRNVGFTYGPGLPPALTDITLAIKAGYTVGIVGPPGSGKTTLLNLIPRLYDVSAGRLIMGGIDIRDLTIDELRSRIAFVPQEPFLFAGTIRDNILFGHRTASDTAIERAIHDAALTDTLTTLAHGLDTVIGERGLILSGGQKQRLALARAFLRDAPLLILDDPVSQVDTETGNAIVRTIRKRAREKTVIVVSHRLSAVRGADVIIALDNGRITEAGTHEELIAGDRYYAKIFHLQELEEGYHGN